MAATSAPFLSNNLSFGSWHNSIGYQIPMPAVLPFIHQQEMEVDSVTAPGMESKSSVRSCTTCSKAKAKCVRRPGEQICERCVVGLRRGRQRSNVLMQSQVCSAAERMPFARTRAQAAQGLEDNVSLHNSSYLVLSFDHGTRPRHIVSFDCLAFPLACD
jgi:hypothetical protein